jgi:hypothetical protein
MSPNCTHVATLEMAVNEINIDTEPLLSFDTLKAAARIYGCKIVEK